VNPFSGMLEIFLIGALSAIGCGLTGPVLLLRRRVLLGDAVSHSVLAGIGITFWIHPVVNSPWLRLGAALSGCCAAWVATKLTVILRGRADAALGLVFPLFFSIGALILAIKASNTHLDVDQVLSGNLESSWLERFRLGGTDLGPQAAWNMLLIVVALLAAGWIWWRDLQLYLFDPQQGQILGRPMAFLEILVVVATTSVIVFSFDAMGPILLVALLAGPGICAWFLTSQIGPFFLATVAAGLLSVLAGTGLACALDLNIAGSIGLAAFLIALGTLFMAPDHGMVFRLLQANRARIRFVARLLAVHICQHEIKGDQASENTRVGLRDHLKLSEKEVAAGALWLQARSLAVWENQILVSTQAGKIFAKSLAEGQDSTDGQMGSEIQRPASLM